MGAPAARQELHSYWPWPSFLQSQHLKLESRAGVEQEGGSECGCCCGGGRPEGCGRGELGRPLRALRQKLRASIPLSRLLAEVSVSAGIAETEEEEGVPSTGIAAAVSFLGFS
jgi:hypothetical protein